jgi:hypothetical protein
LVTVSSTVAERESDPDVPVTVTVEVPALVATTVEMLIRTGAEALPGVTGVDGLKRHCAPAGSPLEHDKVTALVNDVPMGWTDKL